ncbi:anti-sigma factor antagonist [Chlamydia gallinacea]|uniref:Anti-sigma factor antagonist n=2 Tax=Chlamydia gallinacea TaxID=1457153 RepID=A0A173DZF7_9CHLA|nr:anti-sigma factor antagonist [Chlamydia gallinacea]EYE61841.1 anti-anti-sigma factor family protein [Bacteroides fragilis str. S6L5]ANG66295.1 anti-anti-sigma factor [Chlamydia gallinacea 08-1274/3]AQT77499.1 anti-anti-sigma factor [Chlamydia gallinacea]MBX6679871.1 anti-sigma factor antagonist [Chlamydia gallinacea]MBX6687103.1 anti-sigma factor antagonist [Chlamydia gallinacea]
MNNIQKEEHGTTTVFHLQGKLDGISSPEVQEIISQSLSEGAKNIILNCSNLDYMSSAGIRMLLQSYHQVGKNAGKIVLTSVPKTIEQTLYVTGFLSYFKMFDSVQEALQTLGKDED